MDIIIKEGYCYQVMNHLLNITTIKTTNMLRKIASCKGVVKVSKDEAYEQGFCELAEWSMSDIDNLFIIDGYILVCIPKTGLVYA